MSLSTALPPNMGTPWRLALAHADVDEDEVHLLACAGAPLVDWPPSVHIQAGKTLNPDEWADVFTMAAISEANLVENLKRQRIGIRCDFDAADPFACAVVLGLLRHEIQHAHQYSRSDCRQLYALDRLADRVARANDGAGPPIYYRLKPTERDANASSAALLLSECSDMAEQVGQTDLFAPLATPQPMIEVEELPRMTVQFIADHGTDLDRRKLFGSSRSWESLVEQAYTGAGVWWRDAGTG